MGSTNFEQSNERDLFPDRDPFADREPAVQIQGEIISQEVVTFNEADPLPEPVRDELKAWGPILLALKDGLPLPNNPLINIRKIEEAEKRYKKDYSKLKECCGAANEVRDSKDIKPTYFAILDRIALISKLEIRQK